MAPLLESSEPSMTGRGGLLLSDDEADDIEALLGPRRGSPTRVVQLGEKKAEVSAEAAEEAQRRATRKTSTTRAAQEDESVVESEEGEEQKGRRRAKQRTGGYTKVESECDTPSGRESTVAPNTDSLTESLLTSIHQAHTDELLLPNRDGQEWCYLVAGATGDAWSANGHYQQSGLHGGRATYRQMGGRATIYFDAAWNVWKLSAEGGTSGCNFTAADADGEEGDLPPLGSWSMSSDAAAPPAGLRARSPMCVSRAQLLRDPLADVMEWLTSANLGAEDFTFCSELGSSPNSAAGTPSPGRGEGVRGPWSKDSYSSRSTVLGPNDDEPWSTTASNGDAATASRCRDLGDCARNSVLTIAAGGVACAGAPAACVERARSATNCWEVPAELEDEFELRRRVTGVCGRLVRYEVGDDPSADVQLRGGSGKRIEVDSVKHCGKAHLAGIKEGEVLGSIDGRQGFESLPAYAVQRALTAPCTLVFMGFVGKLNAEVRLTAKPLACGFRERRKVPFDGLAPKTAWVADQVVFVQKQGTLLLATKTVGSVAGGMADDEAPMLAGLLPPSLLGGVLDEAQPGGAMAPEASAAVGCGSRRVDAMWEIYTPEARVLVDQAKARASMQQPSLPPPQPPPQKLPPPGPLSGGGGLVSAMRGESLETTASPSSYSSGGCSTPTPKASPSSEHPWSGMLANPPLSRGTPRGRAGPGHPCCSICGAPLEDGSAACGSCGEQSSGALQQQQQSPGGSPPPWSPAAGRLRRRLTTPTGGEPAAASAAREAEGRASSQAPEEDAEQHRWEGERSPLTADWAQSSPLTHLSSEDGLPA